jgi:hypothetical protein
VGRGCRRVKMVQILCAYICKWKMRPVETIPGMVRGMIKENDGGGKRNYYIVRTFVNVTMYPQHNNNFKKEREKKKINK